MCEEERKRQSSIWLEVANVRFEGEKVEILVKGDRADHEPVWREVDLTTVASPPKSEPDHNTTYRTIAEGIDKKRIVIAKLMAVDNQIKCTSIRVQYAESNSR